MHHNPLVGAAACALLALVVACAEPGGSDGPEREPDVVYDPTPPAVVDAMLELAALKSGDLLYDLGSGDGRILIAAAKRYGVRGVGIEIDPTLIERATENAARAGVGELIEFRREDLFSADFHDATVITLFLGPELNLKLRPWLLSTVAPGTRVVSYEYDMGLWEPEVTRRIGLHTIFLWTVPPR